MKIEPITRVEGHLGVDEKVENGNYTDARVKMFRDFEIVLKNKKLDLAPNITGKICRVCGETHTLISIEALEITNGIYLSAGTIDFRRIVGLYTDEVYQVFEKLFESNYKTLKIR